MIWFSTRSDTNQAVQPQTMARGCKFWIWKAEEVFYTIPAAKTKVLISCAVTAQLICIFVFAYAACCYFSCGGSYIKFLLLQNSCFCHIIKEVFLTFAFKVFSQNFYRSLRESFEIMCINFVSHLSCVVRKLTLFSNRSDTNQAVQEQNLAGSLKFWIKEEEELYYPDSENKCADQFHSFCETDLRFCFCICKMLVFS